MTVLPTRRISAICELRPAERRATSLPRAARMGDVRSAPSSAARMRLMTSEPKAAWGLSRVSTPRTSPEARSTSWAATVVVPRSMAMPRPDLLVIAVDPPTLNPPGVADGFRVWHPMAIEGAESERISMRHWPHSTTREDSARALAGETPSGGKLAGGEDGAISVRNRQRTREDAHAAAAALVHAAAGELDAVLGQGGDDRAAARNVELDAERLETNAHAIVGHRASTIPSPRVTRT